MRDLLTDLVRRAQRPESTVQPRLPSAYESLPQMSLEHVADDDLETRVPAAPAPPSSGEQIQLPTRPSAPERHDSPASVTTVLRIAPPESRDRVDHGLRHAPAAASASPNVLGRTAQLGATAPPAAVRAATVATARAMPPHVPSVSVAPFEARTRVVAPIQPVTRAEPPQIRRVRAEPLRAEPADAREQPAPEIRISIGRIEVRATAAERPPARQHRSAPPPLTLDEYLAARARRGTR